MYSLWSNEHLKFDLDRVKTNPIKLDYSAAYLAS